MTNGTRVSVTPRPLFTPRKDPVPIVQEAGWAPGLERCEKSRLPPGFDPRTVQPVASRYIEWATRPTNPAKAVTETEPSPVNESPKTKKSFNASVIHCTNTVVKSRMNIIVTRQLSLFLSSVWYDVTNLIGYGWKAVPERLPREPASSNIRNETVSQLMKFLFPFLTFRICWCLSRLRK